MLRSVCDIMRLQVRWAFFGISGCKRKAYNTVWREGLWMKMREYSITVCKSLYEGVEANVLLGRKCSSWFEMVALLRQDCSFVTSSLVYM